MSGHNGHRGRDGRDGVDGNVVWYVRGPNGEVVEQGPDRYHAAIESYGRSSAVVVCTTNPALMLCCGVLCSDA
jgi:hypothetical protein